MQQYIEDLKRVQAQERQTRHAQTTAYMPIEQQLTELLSTLPPIELQRPWSMADFISRLTGRYRDNPHRMKVSDALRKLGWVRRRDWSTAGGGRRYWYRNE